MAMTDLALTLWTVVVLLTTLFPRSNCTMAPDYDYNWGVDPNGMRGSGWTQVEQQMVSGSQLNFTGRSKVECIRECLKYNYCNRVAFDRSARQCHLLPDYGVVGERILIYEDTDALCHLNDAPIPNNSAVTWRRTLTSLDGYVTCDEQFVWSGLHEVDLTCYPDNFWSAYGECLLKYWINPMVYQDYQIPLSVSTGWRLCATGTPFANASTMSVNLYNTISERPLKVKFYFVDNGIPKYNIKFLTHLGGVFSNQETITPTVFPLTESLPFSLELLASSQYSVDLYVNGIFYHSHTIPVCVSDIVSMQFFGDTVLHDLDLWCQPTEQTVQIAVI